MHDSAETAYTGFMVLTLPSVLNSIADMSADHTQMILSGAMSSPPWIDAVTASLNSL